MLYCAHCDIYNSRNFIIPLDVVANNKKIMIYNSRNFIIPLDYNENVKHLISTIVEIL